MPRVLYVDDEGEYLREARRAFPSLDRQTAPLDQRLKLDEGRVTNNLVPQSIENIIRDYDVVVTDYNFLHTDTDYAASLESERFDDGVDFARQLRQRGFKGKIILFTSLHSADHAREKDRKNHPHDQVPGQCYDDLDIAYCFKSVDSIGKLYDTVREVLYPAAAREAPSVGQERIR